jgi:hypothetical protein
MRARAPQPTAEDGGLPLAIRAGACIETWSPQAGDWREARRRYVDARQQWHADHDVPDDAQPGHSTPWSYDYVLDEQGPELLQRHLVSRGLPLDWTPSPS